MNNKKIVYSISSSIVVIFVFLFSELSCSEYLVPNKPASVDVADINQDGDLDIILGHEHYHGNHWGMISILDNNGNGDFVLLDTISTYHYEISLQLDQINNNGFPDIITLDYDENIGLPYFNIIFDYNLYNWYNTVYCYYDLVTLSQYEIFHTQNIANISFISNTGFLWGVLDNNGEGEFSDPIYYNLENPPGGLACGDLNEDDREDIVICGSDLIVFYNYPSIFVPFEVDSVSSFICDIKISDIDNNGNNEILGVDWGIPGTQKRLQVYASDGNGNFYLNYSKWIDEAMNCIFVADLNNDEFPDVVYNVSYSYPNSDYELFHTYILFNNQDGTFQDPVNYYTGICSHKSYVADLDGNGWNDIITLNTDFYNPPPDTGSVHILFNDGTGNFVEEPQVICDEFKIENVKLKINNHPNPFNPVTTISFELPFDSEVVLNIYNIKGQKVKSLIANEMSKGKHSVVWSGEDDRGRKVSSGVYFYQIAVNGEIERMNKCLLLK
ncbi:MAG: FG-GAP-like repeat-containing protein [Candidatus Stygibacter australis]|nr:FG-GAP-like repeat-containing protein [Candidatus Stygibacter australis]MDP8323293.1 FG-GAP-like repeat-containing protein [Candidatus Stygibacter australis]